MSNSEDHGLDADTVISLLGLEPLPIEGGFFKVSYRANESVQAMALPARYQSAHCLSGAIYFLETAEQFSAMHTLKTDEIYYYHLGDPLEMLILYPDGTGETRTLGVDLRAGQLPQTVVPAGSCHGSRPLRKGKSGFSLVSTSMAPAYETGDVFFPETDELMEKYPDFSQLISQLTR